MTKNELKKTAIEAMNAAGAAMQDGNYAQAKSMAEKAWNCYYELQRQRDEDEDFSDLIDWARSMYYQADSAMQSAPKADESDSGQMYRSVIDRIKNGFDGDDSEALGVAQWHMDPNNWEVVTIQGENPVKIAAKLIDDVLNNSEASLRDRAVAANLAAKMYSTPIYCLLNIPQGIKFAKYAALLVEKEVADITDEEKYDILTTAMELVLCQGDVKLAGHYCEVGLEAGLDKGMLYPLCLYGYRHNEKSAPELENAMCEAGVWQGLFERGRSLYLDWHNNNGGDDEYQKMMDYNNDVLAVYAEEHVGTPSGNAIVGLCCYLIALNMGPVEFLQDGIHHWIEEAANQNSDWANFYYGEIFSVAAIVVENENPDDERIATLRKAAFNYYEIAAALGNQAAIKECIKAIRAGEVESNKLDYYVDLAQKFGIDLQEA